jgi:membrane protein DedA with SNARE-associated domain
MAEILDQLRVIIEQVIGALGLPGIGIVMFAENVFPPIPSELVMPFAGFMVSQGTYNFFLVLLAGTLGSVFGSLVLYYFGMWADDHIIRALVRRYGRFMLLSEDDLDRALAFFDRHGEAVVFFGRFIPLVRSLISIPAGMDRMPLGKFLFFTTLGAVIWNAGLTLSGVMLGAHWQNILIFVKQYERFTLIGMAALLAGFLAWRISRRLAISRNRFETE